MNGKQMADDVLAAIRDVLQRSFAPVAARLKALEDRAPLVGEKGADGERGPQGLPGVDGANGKDGASGRDGIDGKDGKDGIDGKDGRDGAEGKQGLAGKDGAAGRDGVDGKVGDPGKDGLQGKDGAPGKDGIDGADGRDGIDGRDALQLEIVDLDATRAYPRATYATWRGGLMRALRTTEPMGAGDDPAKCGWQVVVNGFADVTFKQDNEREVSMVGVMTSGKRVVCQMKFPVVIDRGVFKAGTAYAQGDGVTYAGSFFIAQKDTSDRPETDSWRLAVKRGRDGKDGHKSAGA